MLLDAFHSLPRSLLTSPVLWEHSYTLYGTPYCLRKHPIMQFQSGNQEKRAWDTYQTVGRKVNFEPGEQFHRKAGLKRFLKKIVKNKSKRMPRKNPKNLEKNQAGQGHQGAHSHSYRSPDLAPFDLLCICFYFISGVRASPVRFQGKGEGNPGSCWALMVYPCL